VASRLKDIKHVRLITKITNEHCLEWYENPVLSLRTRNNHIQTCAEVLSQSDVVVSLGIGTFELMAMYLDIPVITVNNWRPKELNGRPISLYQSEASYRVTLLDLPDAIDNAIRHPENLRKNRLKFIEDNALAPGDASLNIVNVIRESIRSKGTNQKKLTGYFFNLAYNKLVNLLLSDT
jgi:hypothetical protein